MSDNIYRKLSSDIERYILENGITGRLTGIRKLSRKLGVHHVTVTKALRLLEARGLLSIRDRSGTFVNAPSPRRIFHTIGVVGAISIRKEDTRLIELLHSRSYSYINISFEEDLFRENKGLLLNFPVDGFVFTQSSLRREQFEFLRRASVPFVSSTGWSDDHMVGSVGGDHYSGYRMLLAHLKKLGHRRIGFLEYRRVPEYTFYLDNIRRAFRDELGDDFAPELFFTKFTKPELESLFGPSVWRGYTALALEAFARTGDPPSAVIGCGEFALKLAELFRENGFEIPREISIPAVSFVPAPPGFSAIVIDPRDELAAGLEMLLDELEGRSSGSRHVIIEFRFVSGNSVSKAAPQKKKRWKTFIKNILDS